MVNVYWYFWSYNLQSVFTVTCELKGINKTQWHASKTCGTQCGSDGGNHRKLFFSAGFCFAFAESSSLSAPIHSDVLVNLGVYFQYKNILYILYFKLFLMAMHTKTLNYELRTFSYYICIVLTHDPILSLDTCCKWFTVRKVHHKLYACIKLHLTS